MNESYDEIKTLLKESFDEATNGILSEREALIAARRDANKQRKIAAKMAKRQAKFKGSVERLTTMLTSAQEEIARLKTELYLNTESQMYDRSRADRHRRQAAALERKLDQALAELAQAREETGRLSASEPAEKPTVVTHPHEYVPRKRLTGAALEEACIIAASAAMEVSGVKAAARAAREAIAAAGIEASDESVARWRKRGELLLAGEAVA